MSKASKEIEEGFQPGARPICPFCNAPWTDDMINIQIDLEDYESGAFAAADVDITCANCKRLIYVKREY